uniref:Uncharacterized protein n=1 Tax=Anguilla anguilla TaxID=7936 RepID=A0A0E9TV14_ANGAN
MFVNIAIVCMLYILVLSLNIYTVDFPECHPFYFVFFYPLSPIIKWWVWESLDRTVIKVH